MPIEQVGKKISEDKYPLGDQSILSNPAIAAALKSGNIKDVHKLLADYGLTVADFEQFASEQHSKYISMLQLDDIKAQADSMPAPNFEQDFLPQDPANTFSDSDSQYAASMFTKAIGGAPKAVGEGKSGTSKMKAGGGVPAPK